MRLLNTMFKENANTLFNNVAFNFDTLISMHPTAKRLHIAAKEIMNVEGQTKIANLLGESPQTINNWELRGMSKAGMIKAFEIIGCNPVWLKTGMGKMIANAKHPLNEYKEVFDMSGPDIQKMIINFLEAAKIQLRKNVDSSDKEQGSGTFGGGI